MQEFLSDKLSTPLQLQIISNTPGRLRLRIPSQYQENKELMAMASSLNSLFPQIEKVKTNLQTGSITIYYSGGSDSLADAVSKLETLGITLVNASSRS